LKEFGQEAVVMKNLQEAMTNKRRNLLKKTATMKSDITQEAVMTSRSETENSSVSVVEDNSNKVY
jgi:hypothetical protein